MPHRCLTGKKCLIIPESGTWRPSDSGFEYKLSRFIFSTSTEPILTIVPLRLQSTFISCSAILLADTAGPIKNFESEMRNHHNADLNFKIYTPRETFIIKNKIRFHLFFISNWICAESCRISNSLHISHRPCPIRFLDFLIQFSIKIHIL